VHKATIDFVRKWFELWKIDDRRGAEAAGRVRSRRPRSGQLSVRVGEFLECIGRRKFDFRGVGGASIGIDLAWQGKSATRPPKQ
jgi:hypothetical protein